MQSNYDALNEKWSPIIEHADLPEIGDSHKKSVTAVCLENTEKALKEQTQPDHQSITMTLF